MFAKVKDHWYKLVLQANRELAQLVERHPYKVDVAGSNPVLPTILRPLGYGLAGQILNRKIFSY